jgi:hypothetical protein
MQQDGALEKVDKLELTQVRNISHVLLPLTGDAPPPHWILQDMKSKLYHFDQLQVLKMYKNMFLICCRMNLVQFKFTPCGASNAKKKGKHSSTQLQNMDPFNFQQGKRPLYVPLCIAFTLKHSKDHFGCR